MRSSETKANNNEIRTQLLKSLGESFGLSGMKTNEEGKITFSKDFMDKLENILGPAFKREDFGVADGGGAVTSGKPLTARRIEAIVSKAITYDTSNFNLGEYKNKVGGILKEQFGIDSALNYSKEQLSKMENSIPLSVFAGIEKCIDFLEKDFDTFVQETPEYKFAKEIGEQDDFKGVKFQIKDNKTGEYLDLSEANDNNILFETLGGNLLHLERAKFNAETSEDIQPLKDYIKNTLTSFIKNGVDAYMEAKLNGKVDKLMGHLQSPGACTEEKAMRLHEFREKNFQAEVDRNLEVQLNSIINNADDAPFNKVIESEIELIDNVHPEFKTWDQYADELKNRLVGKSRPMVEMKEQGGKIEFIPLKDGKGNSIVRPIKPEDIDTIGKKIYQIIYQIIEGEA